MNVIRRVKREEKHHLLGNGESDHGGIGMRYRNLDGFAGSRANSLTVELDLERETTQRPMRLVTELTRGNRTSTTHLRTSFRVQDFNIFHAGSGTFARNAKRLEDGFLGCPSAGKRGGWIGRRGAISDLSKTSV